MRFNSHHECPLLAFTRFCTHQMGYQRVIGSTCSLQLTNQVMGSREPQQGQYCCLDSVTVTTGICCSSTGMTATPFRILGVPCSELGIAKDTAAFRQVTRGCFCHVVLVKFISASNAMTCWDPSVISEIKRGSSPWYVDGIRVHRTPLMHWSLISLCFWCPG